MINNILTKTLHITRFDALSNIRQQVLRTTTVPSTISQKYTRMAQSETKSSYHHFLPPQYARTMCRLHGISTTRRRQGV